MSFSLRTRLFENLRMLPHAPGVQMADIPADGVTIKEDTDDADPDKRNPQQIKDKTIEPDNEFEEGKSGNKDVNNGKEEPMEVDSAASGAASATTGSGSGDSATAKKETESATPAAAASS